MNDPQPMLPWKAWTVVDKATGVAKPAMFMEQNNAIDYAAMDNFDPEKRTLRVVRVLVTEIEE